MSEVAVTVRNPGPSWGYGFLLWAERWWPRWFFRPLFMAGTWVGFAFMPRQRKHSRDYLQLVFGRPPRVIEMWRHFFAFAESLMFNLRAGRGVPVRCELDEVNGAAFESLVTSPQPAIFGSFHFGVSDMLGYMLGTRGRQVSIIRLRVGNSKDVHLLGDRFRSHVSFLWINDPANLLFEMKAALEAGKSIAMKCDRMEFSAKTEAFDFLGARRLFPFTIYHLAVLFARPVVFCTAISAGENGLHIFSSPVFTPDPALNRRENLEVARVHFQGVLSHVEKLLRSDPYLWFNFLPMNPEAPKNET